MSLPLLLAIVVIVLLLGGLPRWGWHSYGYYPSGVLGIILVLIVVWLLLGRS